jgi:lipooligosaccharide transport system permease protein
MTEGDTPVPAATEAGPLRPAREPRWRAARVRPRLVRWVPVWQRNALVWRKLAVASLLGNFGEPLLYLLALGYGLGALVGEVKGLPYTEYLASGIVCSSVMMTATFEGTYSAYSRLGPQRTWDAIVSGPLDAADVVGGEILWAATKSLLSAVCILLVAAALGLARGPGMLAVLPLAFLTGMCFAAMAMVVTSLARSYDVFLYYTTLFVTPSLLMSGVFFPLEQMPAAVQDLAAFSPLSHVVTLVRPLVTGTSAVSDVLLHPAAAWHLGVPALYCAAAWAAAAALCRRRLAR